MVAKILFITLSNIGDVILTLPALDYLRARFPKAGITVLAGPRPGEIFEGNPAAARFIAYDKHAPLTAKIRLLRELQRERFDLVVDLRNSFFQVLLAAPLRTSPLRGTAEKSGHMRLRHLSRVSRVAAKPRRATAASGTIPAQALFISDADKAAVDSLLLGRGIGERDRILVVAAGARSSTKMWAGDKFAAVVAALVKEYGFKVVLTGDKEAAGVNASIAASLDAPLAQRVLDASAGTTIPGLGLLLKKAALLVTNDSAVLHLASYLDVPTVALFGPTDDEKYGPWTSAARSRVVKKEIFCRPCEAAQCRFHTMDCLRMIRVEDVLEAARGLLDPAHQAPHRAPRLPLKRILITRTDRIGDVVLSTPVIEALRAAYPAAYIAMMVGPQAKEIVEGNPFLDEVIVYDKDGRHKGWFSSIRFAFSLKKKKFDAAFILHPTNRCHLVAFLASIPRRIGYDRKFGMLLTERLPHTKQVGEKHELEYNLDLLRQVGIMPECKGLRVPLKPDAEAWAEEFFRKEGLDSGGGVLAVHPGASCPSKVWPEARFAAAADELAKKYGFKVVVVAGPKDAPLAARVVGLMRQAAVNLAGKTSVSQLASVLSRCRLFVSNDSGPVHIATAVGTPVISIFGRNQRGLSPLRWGPRGPRDAALHKEIGCVACLAHKCRKGFACLKAIAVDDVIRTAEWILGK